MEKVIKTFISRDRETGVRYLIYTDEEEDVKEMILSWLDWTTIVEGAKFSDILLKEWVDLAVILAFTNAGELRIDDTKSFIHWAKTTNFLSFVQSCIDEDALADFTEKAEKIVSRNMGASFRDILKYSLDGEI